MKLTTKRLILRPWELSDAEHLYKHASDPDIGHAAGWVAHTNLEFSRRVISKTLQKDKHYAVCLKNNPDYVIGNINMLIGHISNLQIPENEAEISFWLAKTFWGQGLIPEACCEILRHAFEDIGLLAVWSSYFDGNTQSKRVQEKCGFSFFKTWANRHWHITNEIRTQHITRITKKEWLDQEKTSAVSN